jgi:SagB-type dehydrogenase family enzyme
VLAELLFFAAGLTKKKVYPGGEETHFRAAPSTGALYEVEVYVVAGPGLGLEPGVYHFCPGDFALRLLRPGDHRAQLADAASEPDHVRMAPLTLVLTAIYWRNTWKYRARAFRHFFWDAGTLLANLLATAVAADLGARVLLGFADAAVNELLGLDPTAEGALALVPVGRGEAPAPEATSPLPPLGLRTIPLSAREVDYPLVREAYRLTSLPDGQAARAWVVGAAARGRGRPGRHASPTHALAPLADPPRAPLGEVIVRRGSTRQFVREAIDLGTLSAILDTAARELPLDAAGDGGPLVDTYLLVHAVDGLPAGAYVHEPSARGLRLLRAGAFREEGAYLCLEQALGGDASAVVFFLADLGRVLDVYGDRGYRAANLAAGLLGGRMYLAAYALGLGASGLTFYDDDVVRFFSPDAASKDAIFVTALGRSSRAGRPRGLARLEGTPVRLAPGNS